MTTSGPTLAEANDSALPRFFRFNYLLHCIEGGLYIGGLCFTAANTVLPSMVESLGGPAWLISLTPSIMLIGFVWPPLFTAHWIETLPHVKPALMLSGVFQRTPYLLAALVLFFGTGSPLAAVAAVSLAPLLSGFFGGVTITAWQELVAKTVPPNKRSSVWAVRFLISSAIGIGAGPVIERVMEQYPGSPGYGVLHLLTFMFLFVSYVIFGFIRESSGWCPPPDSHLTLRENLRLVPVLLGNDPRLRRFLVARMFTHGVFILSPFLAIHALRVLNRPESYVGVFVTAQMMGGIVGNLVSGYLGDKHGGKIVMNLGLIVFMVITSGAVFAQTAVGFWVVFFLYGAAYACWQVGGSTLAIEVSPLDKRATYLALIAVTGLPGMLGASVVSTLVWGIGESMMLLGILSAGSILAALLFLAGVEEPRQRPAFNLADIES